MMSDEIFQGIADLADKYGQFGHGHTYSGHPVAAAVALETLKIYEERDIVSQVRRLAPALQDGLRRFADHPLVGNVRGMGLIGGIQLVADKASGQHFDPPQQVAMHLYQQAQHHGVILRAVPVDTIAFCPPLIITADEIKTMLERFSLALDDTWRWVNETGLVAAT